MIFQGLSVARNCLRPKTAPLTILAIQRGLLCNFAKTFKGRRLRGQSITGLKFSITIESSKLSSHRTSKNMSKTLIMGLQKRGHFFQILLNVQSATTLVSQGVTS